MAQQNREPREIANREQTVREEVGWTPPALLPEPIQDPDYSYRWVRVSLMGRDDSVNVNSAILEGYEPVTPEEQPHMRVIANPRSAHKNAIEIGGLLLCKAPRKMTAKRDAYYANLANAQQASVDRSLMKEQDARMPIFKEAKSQTTFGKGGSSE